MASILTRRDSFSSARVPRRSTDGLIPAPCCCLSGSLRTNWYASQWRDCFDRAVTDRSAKGHCGPAAALLVEVRVFIAGSPCVLAPRSRCFICRNVIFRGNRCNTCASQYRCGSRCYTSIFRRGNRCNRRSSRPLFQPRQQVIKRHHPRLVCSRKWCKGGSFQRPSPGYVPMCLAYYPHPVPGACP